MPTHYFWPPLRRMQSYFRSPATGAEPKHHVRGPAAHRAIAETPSALPVEVLPEDPPRLVWLDLGDAPLLESKFRFSVQQRLKACPDAACFSTPLDPALIDAIDNCVDPAGFIFMLHRCGSTLLARSLANAQENLVIGEATSLQEGLWSVLSQGWRRPPSASADSLPILRLVLAGLSRSRGGYERRVFFKLDTFHTLYMSLIRQVFPALPCLFLYRDPVEILFSATERPSAQLARVKGGPAAAMWAGTSAEATAAMSDVDYLVTLYGRYLRSLLRGQGEPISLLRYSDLTAETLKPLLQTVFSYNPSDTALQEMGRAFAFDSKVDFKAVPFVNDSAHKQRSASPALRRASATHLEPLIEQLDRSPDNLGPRLRVTR